MNTENKLTPRFIRYCLFAIVILAFLLRFWGVRDKDMIGDESAYSFRSVGYLDYLGTSSQTQPVEWYKGVELPFWTKLSFHDHPPLTFIIQNIFFRIFGDSLWSARLPSAILGSLSVIFIYLIASILFNSASLSLFSALLLGINNGLISISRTALMEPILLFLILANIYSFLRFTQKRNWWWVFGSTLGLCFLAKYTAIFLIPLYFVYLIFFERNTLKDRRLYLSLILAILIFSPVIVYNYFLLRATGHFDLQFSYLLGQATPEWSGLLGKTQDSFGDIIKNLIKTFGLIDLLIFLGGLVYIVYIFIKETPQNRKAIAGQESRGLVFIFLYLIVLTLLLVKIGSASRFLVLYGPIFVIFSALFINFLWRFSQEKTSILFKVAAVIFIASTLGFSVRENFQRQNINNFGIAELDNFLGGEIDGINSAFVPQTDNVHLNVIIEKAEKSKTGIGTQQPVLIVYNDNVAITTLQWIVYRRFFYHALPFYYVENFIDAINDDQQKLKGTLVYFIQSTRNTLLNPFKKDKIVGDTFEENLVRQGAIPIKIIYGNNSLEMFRIYKFTL